MSFRSFLAPTILAIILIIFVTPVYAQDPTPTPPTAPPAPAQNGGMATVWNQPVNLSRSGAASQPVILRGEESELFAFWWDFYDGLRRSAFNGEKWTKPESIPLPSSNLDHRPFIIRDSSKRFYAFWIEEQGDNQVLIYSTLYPGAKNWSGSRIISASVADYKVVETPDGGLAIAYIQVQNTDRQPSGVYIAVLQKGYTFWNPPVPVYTSIYFRSIEQPQAFLSLSVDESSVFRLAWREPQNGKLIAASSADKGKTWGQYYFIGDEFEALAKPQFVSRSDGEVVLLWQVGSGIACTYYQQEWDIPLEVTGQIVSQQETALPVINQVNLRAPVQIWSETANCSNQNHFWEEGDNFFWVFGEGRNQLTFSSLNMQDGGWSEPYNLQVQFVFEQTQVELSELSAVLYNGQLAVVGTDTSTGEVWLTMTQIGAIDLVYSPRSPWTSGQVISEGTEFLFPTVVTDSSGAFFMVWSQENKENQQGSILFSAFGQDGIVSQTVPVAATSPGKTIARQPAMLIDSEDFIHLTWIDGAEGNVLYQKARPSEIRSAGDWSAPHSLFSAKLASWPQIAKDANENIYILIAVPLNEKRGIYLLHSPDNGSSWGQPHLAINASVQDWQIISHPTMAVTPDGVLHAAWVHAEVPDSIQAQSIVYVYSNDHGITWSDPLEITGVGYDYPHLSLVNEQIHLLYADGAGNTWHRWSALHSVTKTAESWSTPAQVPGFQNTAAQFGVTTSGSFTKGHLHVIGAKSAGNEFGFSTLVYNIWDGDKWQQSPEAMPEVKGIRGLGTTTAVYSRGGILAVSWLVQNRTNDQQEFNRLYLVTRSIADYEDVYLPSMNLTEAIDTPTTVPEENLTPTPDPTATTALNVNMTNVNTGPQPLVLSGVLVFITLVAVIGVQRFLSRDR